MISRIKQITLVDGKQLFYPNEEEVRKLGECIKSVIVEETMTRDEYNLWAAFDKMVDGKGTDWAVIEEWLDRSMEGKKLN